MSSVVPACDCHNRPMRWHKDARRKVGGHWRCRVRRIEVDAKRWQGYAERMPTLVRLRKDLARDRCKRAGSTALARSRVNDLGGLHGEIS